MNNKFYFFRKKSKKDESKKENITGSNQIQKGLVKLKMKWSCWCNNTCKMWEISWNCVVMVGGGDLHAHAHARLARMFLFPQLIRALHSYCHRRVMYGHQIPTNLLTWLLLIGPPCYYVKMYGNTLYCITNWNSSLNIFFLFFFGSRGSILLVLFTKKIHNLFGWNYLNLNKSYI